MYYIVTELQKRPDGIVNVTTTTRSSLALALQYYYQRAAAAVVTTDYLWVGLTLTSEENEIKLNERFETLYEEPASD